MAGVSSNAATSEVVRHYLRRTTRAVSEAGGEGLLEVEIFVTIIVTISNKVTARLDHCDSARLNDLAIPCYRPTW